jgi:hypothetical protein
LVAYDAPVKIVNVVLLSAVLVAGCGSPHTSRPIYRADNDLCAHIDHDGLSAVLGPLKSTQSAPGVAGGPSMVAQSCTFHFGTTQPIPVEVSIQLSTDGASVSTYYEGLHSVEARQTQLSDVSGLGQSAYTYEDTTGPHLVAYDNNLFLSYAVVMGGLPQSEVPSGVVGAEVASAHATMDKLPR